MTVLSEIVTDVKARVEGEKEEDPLVEEVTSRDRRSLVSNIRSVSSGRPVIGELKKRSPSQGDIRSDFRIRELAEEIEAGGASGMSVLTEPNYFGGSLDFLEEVREAVDLPVLRKDFIVDEYQLYQSIEAGADAVLLIAEVLGEDLPDFVHKAELLGLEPLVEARDRSQVDLAASAGAELIGINNRDLRTMEVDLSRTMKLVGRVPMSSVAVSESGIENAADVERVLSEGADAVLVGTSIMESESVEGKVRELVSGGNQDD